MTATRFFDLCSGGGTKTPFDLIIIEAAEVEARRLFGERFGCDPDNVTCDCCGGDFSVSEYDSLDEANYFSREGDEVLVITAAEAAGTT